MSSTVTPIAAANPNDGSAAVYNGDSTTPRNADEAFPTDLHVKALRSLFEAYNPNLDPSKTIEKQSSAYRVWNHNIFKDYSQTQRGTGDGMVDANDEIHLSPTKTERFSDPVTGLTETYFEQKVGGITKNDVELISGNSANGQNDYVVCTKDGHIASLTISGKLAVSKSKTLEDETVKIEDIKLDIDMGKLNDYMGKLKAMLLRNFVTLQICDIPLRVEVLQYMSEFEKFQQDFQTWQGNSSTFSATQLTTPEECEQFLKGYFSETNPIRTTADALETEYKRLLQMQADIEKSKHPKPMSLGNIGKPIGAAKDASTDTALLPEDESGISYDALFSLFGTYKDSAGLDLDNIYTDHKEDAVVTRDDRINYADENGTQHLEYFFKWEDSNRDSRYKKGEKISGIERGNFEHALTMLTKKHIEIVTGAPGEPSYLVALNPGDSSIDTLTVSGTVKDPYDTRTQHTNETFKLDSSSLADRWATVEWMLLNSPVQSIRHDLRLKLFNYEMLYQKYQLELATLKSALVQNKATPELITEVIFLNKKLVAMNADLAKDELPNSPELAARDDKSADKVTQQRELVDAIKAKYAPLQSDADK